MNSKSLKMLCFAALAFLSYACEAVQKNGCRMAFAEEGGLESDGMDEGETFGDPLGAEADPGFDPIVCRFTGAELAERKEALVRDIFSEVRTVEELDTGYRFSFRHDTAFVLKLTDYILTEIACCPFFRFDLSLGSRDEVVLKITGPPEAKEMITMLLMSGS